MIRDKIFRLYSKKLVQCYSSNQLGHTFQRPFIASILITDFPLRMALSNVIIQGGEL